MNENLGAWQGSKHHTPDLTNDIQELMKALRTHHVYAKEFGRVIDDGTAVPDAFVHGLLGPLRDYNIAFKRLRAQHKVSPLVGKNPSSQTMSPISQDMEEVNKSECNRGEGFLGSNGGKKDNILAESEAEDEVNSTDHEDGGLDDFEGEVNDKEEEEEEEEDRLLWKTNPNFLEPIFSFEGVEDVGIDIY